MCGEENTAQAASVEFERRRRSNYARSRLQPLCQKGILFDSLRRKRVAFPPVFAYNRGKESEVSAHGNARGADRHHRGKQREHSAAQRPAARRGAVHHRAHGPALPRQGREHHQRRARRAAGCDLRARGAHRPSARRERQDRLFQAVPARFVPEVPLICSACKTAWSYRAPGTRRSGRARPFSACRRRGCAGRPTTS